MKHDNPWHGLLFLHGHIADQALARSLAQAESQLASVDAGQEHTLPRSPSSQAHGTACTTC
jgi:hypothetical protein